MITLTEEPVDGSVAAGLVTALTAEINERYAYAMEAMTDAERSADAAGVAAEISPDLVRAPLGTFLVAWLDGDPAGCGAVKPLDVAAGIGEVKRMYTTPSARRKGVSRAVLSALEQRAAELGYKSLQLETGTAQPEALALYEAQGWHRIVPYGRYKDEPDSVCFAKDLCTA
ncbi:MAG: GNAT family N-acetyltransferase [Acidimicrobiales bacterium]